MLNALVNGRSAAGAERNDRLSGEISAFKECVDDHRFLVPPDRITDHDDIILGKVCLACDSRTCIVLLFLLSAVRRGIVLTRIRISRFDTVNISARQSLNLFSSCLRISRPGEISNQYLLAGKTSLLLRRRFCRRRRCSASAAACPPDRGLKS